MTIKEVFEQSAEYKDLQALIMFLVFEKRVLGMEDDASELDLYFKEKHKERMNKELNAYKKKMNIEYDPTVFELKDEKRTLYIYAYNEKQARFIASENLLNAKEVKACYMDFLMNRNGKDMTLWTITRDKKPPKILGGY